MDSMDSMESMDSSTRDAPEPYIQPWMDNIKITSFKKKKQNKRKIMQCTSKMTNSNYAKMQNATERQILRNVFRAATHEIISQLDAEKAETKLSAFQSHTQSHPNIHSHHAVDEIRGQLRRQIQQSTKTLRGSGSGSLNSLRLGIHRPQRRCRRDRILRMIPCQFLHVACRIVNYQSA